MNRILRSVEFLRTFATGTRQQELRRRRMRRQLQVQVLEGRLVMATMPLISEFLSSNSGGLQDSDGDSSDWVEIYNPTSAAINLNGWSLTDTTSDLNQWQFPSVSVEANGFLTVFASGKNRTGTELHTNFRLSSTGEYLALVTPTGTVVSEFSPNFPTQVNNVSYGALFDSAQLIQPGAAAQIIVPSQNIGTTWRNHNFNPVGWTNGTTGVGFGVVQPGFNVTYIKSNISVDDLDVARNVALDSGLQEQKVLTTAPVVNYLGNGGGANFANDLPFPTQNIGDDYNDFIIQAAGTVTIPSSGNWTFGVNSDDGFGLRLERNGTVFQSEFPSPRGPSDTLATFAIPDAGNWDLSLIFYERGGGASVELFAASGTFANFSPADFRLVGDSSNGGLAVFSTVGGGSTVIVGTDIGPSMKNVNGTAYVRVPFNMTNPTAYDSMILKMRYDDGFVAYLNGVEVARRNAPATVSFNSNATTDRTLLEAVTPETINLTAFMGQLRVGANVLAIQGLNSSPSDDSFLVLPELNVFGVHPETQRYFATPSPGAANADPSLGIVDRPTTTLPAGFYTTSIQVGLNVPTSGAEIRYTVDGSQPSVTNGTVYAGPITVSGTTTLRAAAFKTGYYSLPSITASYLYLEDVIRQSPSDDVPGGDPDVGAPPPGWPASWGNNVVDYGMDQAVVNQLGAETVKNALRAIPSISISTDLANLFDPAHGIYANANQDGRDWERPASVELLNPDGSAGFQINAGLRIRGGYSRSGDNPKHAFRLFFRNEYGESSLDYPLFGNEGTNSFKKIDLRTSQNYSWSFGGDPSNSFIQDVFARKSQGDMGQPYTRSRWYHLYLDGQYWGVYQTQERAEAEYAASYFGGIAANYDVIKPEAGPYTIYATDGDLNAYQRLWDAAKNQDLSSNVNYFRLQGKNAQGVDDPTIPNQDVLLDVDNLIVYMTGVLHGGNLDAPISWFLGNQGVNNFFAVRDRTGRAGFKYFQHDAEHTLRNINEDRNGPFPAGENFDRFNPQYLHQRLMANPEYRLRFADTVQKVFFNDGPMSVAKAQARALAVVAPLDQAIHAESARWGDAKRQTSPLGRQDWLNAVDGVVNGFLPNRMPVVLQQWLSNGLLPAVAAPQMLVNGIPQYSGQVVAGSTLQFDGNVPVVYTTDGSDPRLVGGGQNPNAMTFVPGSTATALISTGSNWRYFDQGTDLGTSWRDRTFDDTAWSNGSAELGYGDGDETTIVSYGPNPFNKYITTYFRKAFTVADTRLVNDLTLRLKRDDGAVVYLNGAEIARSNMPAGAINAATLASSTVNGPGEQQFLDFVLDRALLQNGSNVLAIEVHQDSPSTPDLSFAAELTANIKNSIGIVINSSTHFFARAFDAVVWSPLVKATYSTAVPASAANLAITELHYNPLPLSGATTPPLNDKENFEFIELRNIGNETIRLNGVRFVNGITFDFGTGTVPFLNPGQSVIVAKNKQAFEARYGINLLVAGLYTGSLNNGGEQVVLMDENNVPIKDFVFDDDPATTPPWPQSADGLGYSLTVVNLQGNYSDPANWRASYLIHGTPGYEENDYPTQINLSNATVPENAPNALVGLLSATDPNVGDVIAFSLLPAGDGSQFRLLGNQLRVGPVGLDYEAAATRSVTIRATDTGGLFIDRTFIINVEDVVESVVVGTAGDDIFELTLVSSNLVSVKRNGIVLGTINSAQFTVDGLGGTDTLRLRGTAGAEQFLVQNNAIFVNGTRFGHLSIENFALLGLAGADSATVQGSDADDVITYGGTFASLNSVVYSLSEIEQSTIDGGLGNDSIGLRSFVRFTSALGGGGIDTLTFVNLTESVNVDLARRTARPNALPSTENRTVDGFENLTGSPFDDQLFGSSVANTIRGGAGKDTIRGAAGADLLFGDAGNDTLFGDAGDDQLKGGANNDILYGLDGLDQIFGDDGDDRLYGGADNDELQGGIGNDTLSGDTGNDLLKAGSGTDRYEFDADLVLGVDTIDESAGALGAGVDLLNFSQTSANIFVDMSLFSTTQVVNAQLSLIMVAGSDLENANGGIGNDLIIGNILRNTLNGGAGNDRLYGGVENDSLIGGIGDDELDGQDGIDTLNGGDGSDQLFGRAGNDVLYGGIGNDILQGNEGGDLLSGDAGDDSLKGGDGNDRYEFVADVLLGTDTIDESVSAAGAGVDLINFSRTIAAVNLNLGLFAISQMINANLSLVIVAGSELENANGGQGSDMLIGNDARNILNGGLGNDSIVGKGGNDALSGNEGSDVLFGGIGIDVLTGASGQDLLVAGTTDYDSNSAALNSIRSVWMGPGTFAQRVQSVRTNPTAPLTGHVFNDSSRDTLRGDSGTVSTEQDMFFANFLGTGVLDSFLDFAQGSDERDDV